MHHAFTLACEHIGKVLRLARRSTYWDAALLERDVPSRLRRDEWAALTWAPPIGGGLILKEGIPKLPIHESARSDYSSL